MTNQERRVLCGHGIAAECDACEVDRLRERNADLEARLEEAESDVWMMAELLRECRQYLPSEQEIIDGAAMNESGQSGPSGVLVRKIERSLLHPTARPSPLAALKEEIVQRAVAARGKANTRGGHQDHIPWHLKENLFDAIDEYRAALDSAQRKEK